MQPHIFFPILIFAFGMGAFLTSFVGDINKNESIATSYKESREVLETSLSSLDEVNQTSFQSLNEKNSTNWIEPFHEMKMENYHYPVTDVSINMPLDKIYRRVKIYVLDTEYLEPYQNFCVNQVLNKFRGVSHKLIDDGDRIKFIIKSRRKKAIDGIIKELKYYDIKTALSDYIKEEES
jgi:hypothetical protein